MFQTQKLTTRHFDIFIWFSYYFLYGIRFSFHYSALSSVPGSRNHCTGLGVLDRLWIFWLLIFRWCFLGFYDAFLSHFFFFFETAIIFSLLLSRSTIRSSSQSFLHKPDERDFPPFARIDLTPHIHVARLLETILELGCKSATFVRCRFPLYLGDTGHGL